MKCIHGIQYCKCLSSACVYLSLCLHLSVHTHIHIYMYTCTCTPTRRPTFTGAYYRFQCAPTPFAAFSPFPLPLRPSHPSRPFYPSRPLRPSVRGRRHWRQPLNRATPYVAAAGHSPSGERPCRRPRFVGPPFLPGRSRERSASGDAFSQEIPSTGEDFRCPRPPPRKAS